MNIEVRLFINDTPLPPAEYGKVQIKSKSIDRIVNDVVARVERNDSSNSKTLREYPHTTNSLTFA